jgi:5-methylcytosine-specific restriction protein A
LSEDGPDTPDNVAAVCPNCHRELHHGGNRLYKREALRRSILERERLT